MGIVVYNPQALKSHFLPFIGQKGLKLEMYDTILLHTVYCPLSINIHVSTGGITL